MAGKIFEYELQVRWSDSDRLGHVNNTRFVEYLQEARAHFITQCLLQASRVEPAGTSSDEGKRDATVVRKLTVGFLQPIFDESGPLLIEISVSHIGRTSFSINHIVRDVGGVMCAHAVAVMVAFDLDAQAPRSLTERERAVLDDYLDEHEISSESE